MRLDDSLTPVVVDSSSSVCLAAENQWLQFKRSSWSFGKLLVEINDQQLYRAEGFNSLSEWAFARLKIKSPSWISKILTTVRYRLASDVGDQLEEYPVFCVEEVARYARQGPDQEAKAVAILESGATQAEIRKQVRALDSDQHEVVEWRHVSLNLPLEVNEAWKTALHRARFLLCKRTPTDAECLELIVTEFMQSPMDPKFTRWVTLDDIDTGGVKCRECGSQNREDIQGDHVLPRSLGGGSGPVVLLCGECHDIKTRNEEGTWSEWARKWGFDPDELRRQYGNTKGVATNDTHAAASQAI